VPDVASAAPPFTPHVTIDGPAEHTLSAGAPPAWPSSSNHPSGPTGPRPRADMAWEPKASKEAPCAAPGREAYPPQPADHSADRRSTRACRWPGWWIWSPWLWPFMTASASR